MQEIADLTESKLIESFIGILFTIILGFVASRTNRVLDNQVKQGTDLEVLKSNVKALTETINSFSAWRNKLMEDEISNLRVALKGAQDELSKGS